MFRISVTITYDDHRGISQLVSGEMMSQICANLS
jgi:hypothetical protein